MNTIEQEIEQSLNDAASMVHSNARNKGFHDEQDIDKFVASQTCNMHAELTEFWDAFRAGKENELCDKAEMMSKLGFRPLTNKEEELADIIIRAFDVSQRLGINIGMAILTKHSYNVTRPHMHGKKN